MKPCHTLHIICLAIRRALLDPGPDLVICDEGHRIKNEKTGTASALNSIKTRQFFVLVVFGNIFVFV